MIVDAAAQKQLVLVYHSRYHVPGGSDVHHRLCLTPASQDSCSLLIQLYVLFVLLASSQVWSSVPNSELSSPFGKSYEQRASQHARQASLEASCCFVACNVIVMRNAG